MDHLVNNGQDLQYLMSMTVTSIPLFVSNSRAPNELSKHLTSFLKSFTLPSMSVSQGQGDEEWNYSVFHISAILTDLGFQERKLLQWTEFRICWH